MGFFERLRLLIWKIRHHDELMIELSEELEEKADEIDRLRAENARLKRKIAESRIKMRERE